MAPTSIPVLNFTIVQLTYFIR